MHYPKLLTVFKDSNFLTPGTDEKLKDFHRIESFTFGKIEKSDNPSSLFLDFYGENIQIGLPIGEGKNKKVKFLQIDSLTVKCDRSNSFNQIDDKIAIDRGARYVKFEGLKEIKVNQNLSNLLQFYEEYDGNNRNNQGRSS